MGFQIFSSTLVKPWIKVLALIRRRDLLQVVVERGDV
jgi:hypothetical protein